MARRDAPGDRSRCCQCGRAQSAEERAKGFTCDECWSNTMRKFWRNLDADKAGILAWRKIMAEIKRRDDTNNARAEAARSHASGA